MVFVDGGSRRHPARLVFLVHFFTPVSVIRSKVFTSHACAACDGLGSAWRTSSRAKDFQLGQFLVQDVKDGGQLWCLLLVLCIFLGST